MLAAAAFEAVRKAPRLSSHAPQPERHYIEILAQPYSADPPADRRSLLTACQDAMSRLTRQYPDDLDAGVLYAESLMELWPWQLWKRDGTFFDWRRALVIIKPAACRPTT